MTSKLFWNSRPATKKFFDDVVFFGRLRFVLMTINQNAVDAAVAVFHDFADVLRCGFTEGTVAGGVNVDEDRNGTEVGFDFSHFGFDPGGIGHACLGGFGEVWEKDAIEETLVFLSERGVDLRIVTAGNKGEVRIDFVRAIEDGPEFFRGEKGRVSAAEIVKAPGDEVFLMNAQLRDFFCPSFVIETERF